MSQTRGEVILTRTLTEVMRLLEANEGGVVTIKQLAELFKVATDPYDTAEHSRKRGYQIEEIAGALEAITLLKQQTGWAGGPLKISLVALRKAVRHLWELGVRYPLAQGVLSWDLSLRRYLFRFDGFFIDAKSGQAQLEAVIDALTEHDNGNAIADAVRIATRRSELKRPVVLLETTKLVLAADAAVIL